MDSVPWHDRAIVSRTDADRELREIVFEGSLAGAAEHLLGTSDFKLRQHRIALPERSARPFAYSSTQLTDLIAEWRNVGRYEHRWAKEAE